MAHACKSGPVRITLVTTPSAGNGLEPDALTALLEDAGHRVQAVSRREIGRRHWPRPTWWQRSVATGPSGSSVLVAGSDTPMAILPMGTANNVGRTLELLGDARPVIESWERVEPVPFDLGAVHAPWGEETLVESFGGGAVAALIGSPEDAAESAVLLGHETDRVLPLRRDPGGGTAAALVRLRGRRQPRRRLRGRGGHEHPVRRPEPAAGARRRSARRAVRRRPGRRR